MTRKFIIKFSDEEKAFSNRTQLTRPWYLSRFRQKLKLEAHGFLRSSLERIRGAYRSCVTWSKVERTPDWLFSLLFHLSPSRRWAVNGHLSYPEAPATEIRSLYFPDSSRPSALPSSTTGNELFGRLPFLSYYFISYLKMVWETGSAKLAYLVVTGLSQLSVTHFVQSVEASKSRWKRNGWTMSERTESTTSSLLLFNNLNLLYSLTSKDRAICRTTSCS